MEVPAASKHRPVPRDLEHVPDMRGQRVDVRRNYLRILRRTTRAEPIHIRAYLKVVSRFAR
jgi:hypothetical protein